ncbi:MAG: tRNA (adenosine(37)-N6)-dimethylallyltransferase MiaA [Burkholderiales bacterium]
MALPCVCLAGPTASGKTACALAAVEILSSICPIEIISVDSALVYQGMDIGTAKPSPAERAAAVHHLIDIIDPSQSYSAARFVQDASRLIGEINARGHWPLLVGGTMLYFKALFDGLDDMPAANPTMRATLAARLQAQGLPALYQELQSIDPLTAQRLASGDTQRILRALEVWHVSGQPLSTLQQRTKNAAHPALISLEPQNRAWLHERIAQRFETMLAQGLVDEVRLLRARGDLTADLPAMRCVGYRQIWQALDDAGQSGTLDIKALTEQGIAATRQLAKRQLTWLRGMPHRRVVSSEAQDVTAQTLVLLRQAFLALENKPR